MYLSSRKIVVFSHAAFYHQLFYCTFIALKNIMLHISASEKITDIPDLCFQHSFKALSKNESEGGKKRYRLSTHSKNKLYFPRRL